MRGREDLIVVVRLVLALSIFALFCVVFLHGCAGRKYTIEVNPDRWSIENQIPPVEEPEKEGS